jgi:alkylation response protein AidB-like acyl-CoA dehydrogenase
MNWTIEDTPERAAFREEVRGWLRENLPAGWADAIESGDAEGLDKAREGWDFMGWSKIIGESGYGAPLWPKEFGGLSGEPWQQNVVREELARYRLPTVGVNILGVGLAGPTLIAHGSEDQKARYLQKILTSEEIWCQLFSEPGAGSDLASCGTRAVRSGDEWIVNGQKVWTSIAQLSQFGMLLARTDPDNTKHEGLSYFIVDMKAPGVDIRPLKQITGSAEFNEVYFTDVRIPAENIVGVEGDGWRVARTTLMNERVALSGLSLDSTSFTGGSRKDPWAQFVESIPDRDDPVNRQFIAQSYIEKEVKEITQFRANSARMRGEQPGPEGAVTKVYNAEFNKWRSNGIMNANGLGAIAWEGGDTMAENRYHAFMRARANSIEGGTSEILRTQMGERILGLPREPEVDRGIPWKDIKRS